MLAIRKRWWRAAAIAAVGGGALAGGWFGFVEATASNATPITPPTYPASWTRPDEAPAVAEANRPPEFAAPGPVTLASGAQPSQPGSSEPVVPAAATLPGMSAPSAPLVLPPALTETVPGTRAP